MKERPILFSAPMVKALLAWNKSQTRRMVKPQPDFVCTDGTPARFTDVDRIRGRLGMTMLCPYGQPGDRLWVKETFAIVPRTAYRRSDGVQQTLRPNDDHDAAIYRAGWDRSNGGFRWRPSIHMPRWASRITLKITGVRVERVQEISEADAVAEGVEPLLVPPDGGSAPYTEGYRKLWEQINGPESWDANPFVWVVAFKRVTP